MKPMLSFHYKNHMAAMPFPCYMQPKLDGIRLMAQGDTLQSRSHGKEEEVILGPERLSHIRAGVKLFDPSIVLDGELYVHGWSRQQINGAARVRSLQDGEKSPLLEYHIFDCILTDQPEATFRERWQHLSGLFYRNQPGAHGLRLVETAYGTKSGQDAFYQLFKRDGYEGAMYKHPDMPYGFSELCGNKENRWKYTLKRKDWLDGEFECLDIQEGEGKYKGKVGALCFRTKEGRPFTVGSGITDADREFFWSEPPIGSLIHIRYDIISDDGIPIQPRFDHIIED